MSLLQDDVIQKLSLAEVVDWSTCAWPPHVACAFHSMMPDSEGTKVKRMAFSALALEIMHSYFCCIVIIRITVYVLFCNLLYALNTRTLEVSPYQHVNNK